MNELFLWPMLPVSIIGFVVVVIVLAFVLSALWRGK